MYASVSHLIERVTTVLAYATHHLNMQMPIQAATAESMAQLRVSSHA
jgi:hypothetical protein